MSKEPKNLLKADLILNYYKDDITERYTRNLSNNIVMDNDILYVTNEKVYITTLEKHCELQQRIDKAVEYIKHSWWLRLDQVYDTSKDLKGWEVEQLLEILKGGNND